MKIYSLSLLKWAIQHGARSQNMTYFDPASLFDWAFYYDALSSLSVYLTTRSYYRKGEMLPYGQKLLFPLIANINY
jgi:hypothetical protein